MTIALNSSVFYKIRAIALHIIAFEKETSLQSIDLGVLRDDLQLLVNPEQALSCPAGLIEHQPAQ